MKYEIEGEEPSIADQIPEKKKSGSVKK